MVVPGRVELPTYRLSADRSTTELRDDVLARVEGIEPPTRGFGDRCSTTELHPYGAKEWIRTTDTRIFNPVLYQAELPTRCRIDPFMRRRPSTRVAEASAE